MQTTQKTTLSRLISPQNARVIYFTLSAIGLLYHFLVLTQVVNYAYAWGGRLTSLEQMYTFEIFSVILQLVFAFIVYKTAIRSKNVIVARVQKLLLGLLSLLFVLNTIGNVFAMQPLEMILFTPITFVMALITFRLAIE